MKRISLFDRVGLRENFVKQLESDAAQFGITYEMIKETQVILTHDPVYEWEGRLSKVLGEDYYAELDGFLRENEIKK